VKWRSPITTAEFSLIVTDGFDLICQPGIAISKVLNCILGNIPTKFNNLDLVSKFSVFKDFRQILREINPRAP
jgi:hypothetical protein